MRTATVAGVRGAALALTIVVAGLILAAPADAALRFKRCGGYGFRCARLSVPLDRAGALPGRVSLLVKRFPARRRGGATQPPLFVLAGGPGQSATDAFGGAALGVLHPASLRRDLIVFDQRGTGSSGLLRCRRLERANLLRAGAAAGACASSLGAAPGLLHEPRLGRRHRGDTRAAGRGAHRPVRRSPTARSSRSGTRSAIRRGWSASSWTRSCRSTGRIPITSTRWRPRGERFARSAAATARGRATRSSSSRRSWLASRAPVRCAAASSTHAAGRRGAASARVDLFTDPRCGRLRPAPARRLSRRRRRGARRRRDAAPPPPAQGVRGRCRATAAAAS